MSATIKKRKFRKFHKIVENLSNGLILTREGIVYVKGKQWFSTTWLMLFLSFLSVPFCFSFLVESHSINVYNLMFLIAYACLFSIVSVLNSNSLKKVVYVLLYSFVIIYSFVQYFNYIALTNYFSLFDIYNASEAFDFLDFIIAGLNLKLIVILIFYLVLMIKTLKVIAANKNKNTKRAVLKLIVAFILFQGLGYGVLFVNHIYEESETTYSDAYFYNRQTNLVKANNFTDKKASMELLHLYKYFERDCFNFLFNQFNVYVDDSVVTTYDNLSDKETIPNEYTGMFKDENVIFILLESIDTWIINEENMPTLTSFMQEGINFTNHYALNYNGPRTLNTEYTMNTGFYIPRNYNVYESTTNNYKFSLANLFNDAGYLTTSIHANRGNFFDRTNFHENWGYDQSYFLLDIYNTLDVLDDTYLNSDEITGFYTSTNEKFMSYVITYSGHGGYVENGMCEGADADSEVACYSHLVGITDEFLSNLVAQLEKDNLLDNTTLVLFGDHYAYGFQDKEILYSMKDTTATDIELERVPFVIWNNRMSTNVEFNTYSETSDILPTVANMFNLEYNPNYFIGDDLFSSTYKNYMYLPNGSVVGSQEYAELAQEALKYSDYVIQSNYFNGIK